MKKLSFLTISILVLSTMFGCNSSPKGQEQTEEVKTDTLCASADDLYADFEDFFTNVFNERLYEEEGFLTGKLCTTKLLAKLKDAYDYEGEEGYATWLFRSENQDGPSDEYGLTKIVYEGDGWFKYDFVDMGNKGSHRIKVLVSEPTEDHIEYFIDEIE